MRWLADVVFIASGVFSGEPSPAFGGGDIARDDRGDVHAVAATSPTTASVTESRTGAVNAAADLSPHHEDAAIVAADLPTCVRAVIVVAADTAIAPLGVAVISVDVIPSANGDVCVQRGVVEIPAELRPCRLDPVAADRAVVGASGGCATVRNESMHRWNEIDANSPSCRRRNAGIRRPASRIDRREVGAVRRSTNVGRVPEFQNADPLDAVIERSDTAVGRKDAAAVARSVVRERTVVSHTITSAVGGLADAGARPIVSAALRVPTSCPL